MHALTYRVRHPSHRKNVAGTVKGEGIVEIKTLAGEDLGMDGRQAGIIRLKGMGLKSLR